MIVAHILQKVARERLRIVVDGNQLRLACDHRPPAELLDLIAANKVAIIEHLNTRLEVGRLLPREQGWLASIAGHLGCLPQRLLDAELIDRDDLAEQADADPAAVARLIQNDPRWIAGGGR